MSRSTWIKPLLRKEWIQNRLLFVVTFLLLSLYPTMSGLLYWLGMAYEGRTLTGWARALEKMLLHNDGSTLTFLGIFLIPTIAIRLLGDERREHTLEFLVALPISRTQIALAKYMAGLLFVWITVFANMLFVVIMTYLIPAAYQIGDAFRWHVATGMVLTALYSLGFLCATVTGRRMSAYLLTALVLFFPKLLAAIMLNIWWSDAEPLAVMQFNEWTDSLSLHAYLFMVSGNLHEGTTFALNAVMALISAAFLTLSLVLFRRNQLERNGHVMIFTSK
ncbi:ABC transporter permease [Brevibacillus fluminis]|nr:ABC transporter permease subunit [Brevibacillus fluminis]